MGFALGVGLNMETVWGVSTDLSSCLLISNCELSVYPATCLELVLHGFSLAFVRDLSSTFTAGFGLFGFLSKEERALGGICCVLMRFFFLEYFYVLLAVLGMPSMMT